MTNLPLAAIKRIAAVKGKEYRVGEDAVEIIDIAATEWIKKLAEEGYIFATHAQRRTLKAADIMPVLERMGIKLPAPVTKQKAPVQKPAKPKKEKPKKK